MYDIFLGHRVIRNRLFWVSMTLVTIVGGLIFYLYSHPPLRINEYGMVGPESRIPAKEMYVDWTLENF